MSLTLKSSMFAAVLGLAACANPPPMAAATPPGATTPVVRDTGNMAYPAPLPQGNVSTTTVGRPSAASQTGNMAYPAPNPQGVIRTTP